MNRVFLATVAVMVALVSSSAAQTPIRTVVLSDHAEETFKVAAGDAPSELKFPMGSNPYPKDATLTKYVLRVVSTQSTAPRGDQDVFVLAQAQRVGQWSASGEQAKPYSVDFEPKNDSSPDSTILTLQTESENADWDYHGGGAKEAADRPRLIVTHEVPSPRPISRSGQAHRSSTSLALPDGTQLQLRANSVLYEGAEYLIARPGDTQRLYRLAAGGVTDWQLAGIDVTAKSFAFVTAWGRLQIITKDAIGSCDLEKLGEQGSVVTCMVNERPNSISVEPGERPAMGPDGSVYFRNVQASGKIVAYNPSLQEIWRTDLVFTAVSPVSLSENGHFAYTLAKFLDDQSRITLVRIDTATGETVASDIKYTDAEGDVYLPLIELLQPAVKSSEDSDYVFVAGNTHDTGVFQLVEFKPDAENASVLWSRLGKVTKSESSVAHNISMTLFGDGSLAANPFDGSADPKLDESAPVGSAGALLADGPVPLFILYTNQDIENKLDELAEGLDMLDEKLDRERDEISNRLDAQDQKLDRDLGEVTKRLQEQDQKFDEVSTSLAEQRRELAEVNEQISELMRPVEQPKNWVAWTGVFIGICSLLACWILTRKVRTVQRPSL